MKDISIVVVTPHDPADVRHWSGTPHYMLGELRRRFSSVSVITGRRSSYLLRLFRFFLRPLGIEPQREMWISRILGRLISWKLQRMSPDLVVGIAASHMIADLRIDAPLVYFTDATFASMVDYNEAFSGLSRRTLRNGNEQERAAMSRAALTVMASDWAVRPAIGDYGVPPGKVAMLPLGANLEEWPEPPQRRARGAVLRLLFVGTNWRQKGGDTAVEVMRQLRACGVEAELHVVGCEPPSELAEDGLHRHGFLHKSVPIERDELIRLYRTSSFFLLPTLAEAYGLVFAEASAYGLPIIARHTGGTASPVETGVNGALMEETAGPDVYAKWLFECWHDEARYERLRESSRRKFEVELNWQAWGDKVEELAGQIIGAGGSSLDGSARQMIGSQLPGVWRARPGR